MNDTGQLENKVFQAELDYKSTKWRTMWRPFMAYQYGIVCLCDFTLIPIIMLVLGVNTTHTPFTLQGGGLYHLAMGAIVGISTWGRSEEKKHKVAGTMAEKD